MGHFGEQTVYNLFHFAVIRVNVRGSYGALFGFFVFYIASHSTFLYALLYHAAVMETERKLNSRESFSTDLNFAQSTCWKESNRETFF